MRYLFTKKGFKALKKQIQTLENKIKEVKMAKGEAAAGQDGWHDEGFQLFQREEMWLSKRLSELQSFLSDVEVVVPEEQNEIVKIGNGVVVEYEDGSIFKFILDGYLVGTLKNRVSVYSPVGRVLLNVKKGEKRILHIGGKERIIKVKEIFLPSIAKSIFEKEKEERDD